MPKFSDFDLKISLLLSSEKTFSAEKASPILQDRVMPEREILHLRIKRLPSFFSYRSRRLGLGRNSALWVRSSNFMFSLSFAILH